MSLRALLTGMSQQVEGAYAVMLMGYDCIAIDEIHVGTPDFDVQMMIVEYATVIKEIQRTVEVVGAGDMEEITITTKQSSMILRVINEDLFSAFVLSRDGNVGKARYLLRTNALAMVQALE